MSTIKRFRFDLILIIITSLGSGFMFLIFPKLSWQLDVLISVSFIILIIFLLSYKISFEEKEKRILSECDTIKDQRDTLLIEKERSELQELSYMAVKALEAITGALRYKSEEVQNIHKSTDSISNKNLLKDNILKSVSLLFTEILKKIDSMFDYDKRGIDFTSSFNSYFKVALFRKRIINEKPYLERIAYYYPQGIEPDNRTSKICIDEKKHCAHVLALLNDDVIIIEDIQEEIRKPEKETRWMDLRHNQHADYQSMVCVPIVRGKKETSEREVIAVLVIDTNRKRYFKEDKGYRAFLGTILSPFRTLITLTFDIENIMLKFNSK